MDAQAKKEAEAMVAAINQIAPRTMSAEIDWGSVPCISIFHDGQLIKGRMDFVSKFQIMEDLSGLREAVMWMEGYITGKGIA